MGKGQGIRLPRGVQGGSFKESYRLTPSSRKVRETQLRLAADGRKQSHPGEPEPGGGRPDFAEGQGEEGTA